MSSTKEKSRTVADDVISLVVTHVSKTLECEAKLLNDVNELLDSANQSATDVFSFALGMDHHTFMHDSNNDVIRETIFTIPNLMACLIFEQSVAKANATEVKKHLPKQRMYYAKFFASAVNFAWSTICAIEEEAEPTEISINVGLLLVGLDVAKTGEKNLRDVSLPVTKFKDLYDIMVGYYNYLKLSYGNLPPEAQRLRNRYSMTKAVAPTPVNMNEYLVGIYDEEFKYTGTICPKQVDLQKKDIIINHIDFNQYLKVAGEDARVGIKGQYSSKDSLNDLKQSMSDVEQCLKEKLSRSGMPKAKQNSTFKELLSFLTDRYNGVTLDDHNQVVMDRNNWCTFSNSFLVSYMFYEDLVLLFHPREGGTKTLEVLSKVTSDECAVTNTNEEHPQLKMCVQENPDIDGEYICVITMQNHLSKHYIEQVSEELDELKYFTKSNKSREFIRVFSETPTDDEGMPYMEFGKNAATKELFEADVASKHEHDFIDMTNFVLRIQDKAIRRAIDYLQLLLLEERQVNYDDGVLSYARISTFSSALRHEMNVDLSHLGSSSDVSYRLPVSVVDDEVLFGADSGHINIGKSYSAHNDTENKVGNYNDGLASKLGDVMRIFTQGFQFTNVIGEAFPPDNLTIKHGSRQEEYTVWWDFIGCFSNEGPDINFTHYGRDGHNNLITFGGVCHAHIQPMGSQKKDIVHLVESNTRVYKGRNSRNDIKRAFISTRNFIDQRRRVTVSMEGVYKHRVHISKKDQDRNNVIQIITGKSRDSGQSNKSSDSGTSRTPSKRKCIDSSSSSSNKKARKISSNNIQTAKLQNWANQETAHCKPLRPAVIGVSNDETNKIKSTIACHYETAKAAFDKKTTLKVDFLHGDCISERKKTTNKKVMRLTGINGPAVYIDEEEDKCYLFRPLDKDDHILCNSQIDINSHHKDIVNPNNPDVICLHRLGKNSASLISNINNLHERRELKPMWIRSSGGALTEAGQYSELSNKVDKQRPTIELCTPQNPYNAQCMALEKNCIDGRGMNVYFDKHYIGYFYIRKKIIQRYTKEEAIEELNKFNAELTRLFNNKNSGLPTGIDYPREATAAMINELNGVRTLCVWFELVPVFPLMHCMWKDIADKVEWNQVTVTNHCFQAPRFACDPKQVDKLVGINKVEAPLDDFVSLLEYCVELKLYYFLSDIGRQTLGWEDDAVDPLLLQVGRGDKIFISKEMATHAMIHAGAATLFKATTRSIVSDDGMSITTSTKAMAEEVDIEPEKLIHELNLMTTLVKPCHPPILSMEPPVYLGLLAAEKCDNESETRKRNFLIIFQVIMIQITNPMHYIQQAKKVNAKIGQLIPNSEKLKKFICNVEELNWKNTFIHLNFRTLFKTKEEYVSFIKNLNDNLLGILDLVYTKDDRQKCQTTLIEQFQTTLRVSLTPFMAQVIMRAIEMVIDKPFGEVDFVEGGPGSRNILLRLDEKDWTSTDLKTVTGVAKDFLKHLNEREWKAEELTILGLIRSGKNNRLCYKHGIQKELDLSDIEHALCMVYRMLHNTSPTRNLSENIQYGYEKFFPIKLEQQVAAGEEFMSLLTKWRKETIEAYKKLLQDRTYEGRILHDIFRINFDSKESLSGAKKHTKQCEEITSPSASSEEKESSNVRRSLRVKSKGSKPAR